MSVKRNRGGRAGTLGIGHSPAALSYRGTGGLADHFYLAELNDLHQVVRRASPTYSTQLEGVLAWARRRDRKLRLVREITVREVIA